VNVGCTIKKTGYNGRRVMYFRGDSRRDSDIPEAEQAIRWAGAFTQYCKPCSDRLGLESGKCARIVGQCGICGEEGFIFGRLSNDYPAMVLMMNRKGIKEDLE
jgi:hypothetical protein